MAATVACLIAQGLEGRQDDDLPIPRRATASLTGAVDRVERLVGVCSSRTPARDTILWRGEREPMTGKSDSVRAMFTRIAGRYDLMNSVMTGGRHHAWRRLTAGAVTAAPEGPALDLATGTADLALAVRAAAPRRTVVGADFAEAMLHAAAVKLAARGERRVPLLAADALALPFADQTFACVTSAFLLRNLADLPAGLAEMRRVTLSGGVVAALEITRPGVPGWDALFGLYFNRLVPLIGAAVARDRAAYTYLPRSVERFVTPAELARLMGAAGLRDVRYRRLALGTIALHIGVAQR